MPDFLLVLCSCRDEAEARHIAATVVAERWAACANVGPPVESTYRWNEKIEMARETMLTLKTTVPCFEALERRIKELHSYAVPEIIAIAISKGSDSYLSWIEQNVSAR